VQNYAFFTRAIFTDSFSASVEMAPGRVAPSGRVIESNWWQAIVHAYKDARAPLSRGRFRQRQMQVGKRLRTAPKGGGNRSNGAKECGPRESAVTRDGKWRSDSGPTAASRRQLKEATRGKGEQTKGSWDPVSGLIAFRASLIVRSITVNIDCSLTRKSISVESHSSPAEDRG